MKRAIVEQIFKAIFGILLIVSLTSCGGGGGDSGGGAPLDGDDSSNPPGTGAGSAPSAPTTINLVPGNGQITVSWNSVPDATSYNLYWNTASGVSKTGGTKITDTKTPYAHTARDNGTTYFYVVTAVNINGESVESQEVSATPSGPPTVTLTIPAKDTTGVAVNSVIEVVFSEPMDAQTVTSGTFFISGIPATATHLGRISHLTPSQNLSYNTTYNVTVTGAVRTATGFPLGSDYTWSFRTGLNGLTIKLPKTGQTVCSDTKNTSIFCAGTGQDGELQAGFAWPDPRFMVGSLAESDCVVDRLTGLMWFRFADITKRTWVDSVQSSNNLVACGWSDWRLPNRNELRSLLNYGQPNLSVWLATQGFNEIQRDALYWTSTTHPINTASAWTSWLGTPSPTSVATLKSTLQYSLPVRGITSGPGSSPKTGQVRSYAAGDDGDHQAGIEWPSPRFIKSIGPLEDCIIDNLTGLMWAKDGGGVNFRTFTVWDSALKYANGLKLCGFDDWRLPNVNEIASLMNADRPFNDTWLNAQGFFAIEFKYWSSTSLGIDALAACMHAWLCPDNRNSGTVYAIPVRGGY